MCIGSSVAELVSAYPTAGGMYFVTKHVVPADQVPIFAWIQGWCNLLGQTAGVSSVGYTVSQMLLACVSMNSDLVDGQYSYSPYVISSYAGASLLMLPQDCVADGVGLYCAALHHWRYLLADNEDIASDHLVVRPDQQCDSILKSLKLGLISV